MDRQIIIVSRDAQFRNAFKRGCTCQSCRVETADTVTTALDIAENMPVCVVVAEVSIEEFGDGVGLADALHDQNPEAKCFLIVDEEFSFILSSLENQPWLRFVHKPIPMLRFAADVVDAIEKSIEGEMHQ